MRKMVAVLLAAAALLLAALPATDAFTDSDDVALATHNANWTVNANGFFIYSNSLRPQLNVQWSVAHWDGDAFADNQYAQAKIAYMAESQGRCGPAVRMSHAGVTGYCTNWKSESGGVLYLGRLDSGTWTTLGSYTGTLSIGDVILLEVAGTSITVKQNGTLRIGPTTDNQISSGSAGILGYDETNNVTQVTRMDDWEGGNITAAGRRRVVMAQ
jgi:hypothetical protein